MHQFTVLLLMLARPSQGFLFSWWWEQCYGRYGCFNADSPFDNARGYVPESPDSMDIEFLLFTRSNREQHLFLEEDYQATVESSNYNAGKPTKFIIHGYMDSGRADWVGNLTEELLTADDVNVIAVDWQKGADNTNYFQAAANTRIVGAVTAEMIETLNAAGASFSSIHLIGHSLGAQTAGYVGEIIDGLGRITGLDPAGNAFENYEAPARLDPDDAIFVDVIHSDAESLTALGFGMMKACGDADFYPNGGLDQPGCPANAGDHLFTLFTGGFGSLKDGAACSHVRAIDFFSSSINNHCEYESYPCTADQYDAGQCTDCGEGCSNMGYHASSSLHGSFYLSTSADGPYYCCAGMNSAAKSLWVGDGTAVSGSEVISFNLEKLNEKF